MATYTTLPLLRLAIYDLMDQGSIAIADLSSYATSGITGLMQVTPPGWPTIGVPFTPGRVNIYKCGDLGITCDILECCPLPDGIYDFVYTVSGVQGFINSVPPTTSSVEKTFMKVDQLDCRIMNLFLKIDLDCDCGTDDQKKYKSQLKDIELLRDGAVAAANNCDPLNAYRLYKQADRYIDRVYSQFCSMCTPIPSCEVCN